MDSAISVAVFNWRGECWITVDRILRHDGRRYAPRRRLASFRAATMSDLPEEIALEWLVDQLTIWVNAGAPPEWHSAPKVPSAPLGRGHRVRRVASGESAGKSLPSKTATPPPMGSASAASTIDGLQPPGEQLDLW